MGAHGLCQLAHLDARPEPPAALRHPWPA